MASESPDPATLTLIGSLVAALAGAGGLVLSARRNGNEAMSAIVHDALAVSDRNKADARDCQQRLDECMVRIDVLAAKVALCEDKHAAAEVEIAQLQARLT